MCTRLAHPVAGASLPLLSACPARYHANFGAFPHAGDITEVDNAEFPAELDLLVGGFPCQTFSTAGEQAGLARWAR